MGVSQFLNPFWCGLFRGREGVQGGGWPKKQHGLAKFQATIEKEKVMPLCGEEGKMRGDVEPD